MENACNSFIKPLLFRLLWFFFTSVFQSQSYDETVSRIIAAFRRLRVAEAIKIAFLTGPSLRRSGTLDIIGRYLLPKVDRAFPFLTHSILEHLSGVLSNNAMSRHRNEWPRLYNFPFRVGCLPVVFATLPTSVPRALNIVLP